MTSKEMTNAQRIGEITKALKLAAKRCGIPIVLLCQLNREKDKGASREPKLTDLRDSGEIEQDADVVLMLDQEKKIIPDGRGGAGERQIMVLWVRKMREGIRDFRIDLLPNESYTRFLEIAEQ
jgi:replicative DNA helicase